MTYTPIWREQRHSDFIASQTLGRWVAGSSPAMTRKAEMPPVTNLCRDRFSLAITHMHVSVALQRETHALHCESNEPRN